MSRRQRIPVVAALFLAVLAAGCSGFGTPAGYVVEAEFPRTFNLFPGSPVKILGLEAGIVETLDFDEGQDTVLARLRIDPDVRLPADVRAFILTDALLGERIVQLTPAYTDGPTFEAGGRIEEVGAVPAEFDELLDALNGFVEGIQGGDLPRLVDNLAELLDGNGDNLGKTLEATRDALNVLRDHDEDLIRLASKLSGVNETLNQRRTQLGDVIRDFAELSRVLADQRVPLDQALSSLAVLADEAGRLLDTNRTLLERDVSTLTRVGRTAVRNLDDVSAMLLNSAELFRHAERVLNRDHNWLPLTNNTDQLVNYILETLQDRIFALCKREGLDQATCEELANLVDGILPDRICLPPLLDCGADPNGDGGTAPLGELLTEALTEGVDGAGDTPEEQQALDDLVADIVGRFGSGLDGPGEPGGDDTGGAP
jgi:phospholipid/cholesterol/gamma-HCH transport system substrate-binding protein